MAGKGQPKSGGRQKGSTNKLTADVKDMILAALTEVGGVEYLVKQAQTNSTSFNVLLGKVMPTQLTGKDGAPLTPPVITIARYADDPTD